MKEDQRKLLEVHELMDNHEWKSVARSFQVCECGMCRGSETAFTTKTSRGRMTRWGRRIKNNQTTFTDWLKLSEVTETKRWFENKHAFIERIKDYLIQFPYWAGVYAKKTGNTALLEVMKKNDELRLTHAIRHDEFTVENETALRTDLNKLIDFLKAKKYKVSPDNPMEVCNESTQAILNNGAEDQLMRLAEISGHSEEILTRLIEMKAASTLKNYAHIHNDSRLRAAMFEIATNDIGETYHLLCYETAFGDVDSEEVKKLAFRNQDGTYNWMTASRKNQDIASLKDGIDALIAFKADYYLYNMVRMKLAYPTKQVMELALLSNSRADALPLPGKFDKELWDVVISLARSKNMAKNYLIRWKQYLRDEWTEKIKDLESAAADMKAAGLMADYKDKMTKCNEVKRWAHGLLVDYKKALGLDRKKD